MVNEADMQAALAECNLHLLPNYSTIALSYNVERSTLSKRYYGQTTSRAATNSLHRHCLTNAQEDVLTAQINKLTVRYIPLIS